MKGQGKQLGKVKYEKRTHNEVPEVVIFENIMNVHLATLQANKNHQGAHERKII